ncbi:hypothetical protein A3J20_06740 [Candidatus Gottesmanbacteria bacterium RIFCSPLOWO2_02_FULL_42_29]|nr:MAG: hypothetical protein A3E72_05830 [Candidatus Gottesmanbacteria bacterium RIFCSPHIGHO2_12_FULL_43_26]OGG36524.1 MAG: hypothetical protein A3J20_06740 [Candidatus Gottesmanbacteria bacterium RIFCSPLOWO2_02_FULL_42_29]
MRFRQLEDNLRVRREANRIWNIDPDVLVERKATGFSTRQTEKLRTLIENSGGLYFLGDDLTKSADKFPEVCYLAV